MGRWCGPQEVYCLCQICRGQPAGCWDRMGSLANCFVVWGKRYPSPKERQPLHQPPGHKNPLQTWPDLLSLLYGGRRVISALALGHFYWFHATGPQANPVFRPSNRPQRYLQINLRLLRLVSKRLSPGSSDPPLMRPFDGHRPVSGSPFLQPQMFPQRHPPKRARTQLPLPTSQPEVCLGPAGLCPGVHLWV